MGLIKQKYRMEIGGPLSGLNAAQINHIFFYGLRLLVRSFLSSSAPLLVAWLVAYLRGLSHLNSSWSCRIARTQPDPHCSCIRCSRLRRSVGASPTQRRRPSFAESAPPPTPTAVAPWAPSCELAHAASGAFEQRDRGVAEQVALGVAWWGCDDGDGGEEIRRKPKVHRLM